MMTRWLSGTMSAIVAAGLVLGCAKDTSVSTNSSGAVDGQIKGTWCLLTATADTTKPAGLELFKNPVDSTRTVLTIAGDAFTWAGTTVSITSSQGLHAENGAITDSLLGQSRHPRYWYSLVDVHPTSQVTTQLLCLLSSVLQPTKPSAAVTLATPNADVFCKAADTSWFK